ncbi:Amino acid transporter [Amycolatopsis xylanica]|uniref:Amino acid transporter n=1 Tax=Amycolatopsis xylanica TaxID=589385 RepID=A0A1H3SQZ6_9PSEU|nr:APC family permease [Amycolatopsis xylanica]SDZ39995.1 Amino acid transporter [Amycolatopsis xylanica]
MVDIVDGLGGGFEEQRSRLQKSLRRKDVVFFLLCTLVGLDTIGSVAAQGPQGLTWMVILAVLFFLPYGLLVAELGTAFPVEGGPYIWTKLAFGKTVAGINQVLYWLTNPIWMGGSLTIIAVATTEKFFIPLGTAGKYIAGVLFIWFGVLCVAASLKVGKWVPTAGALARIVLLGFFTVSVVVYAIKNGVQPLTASSFAPTYAGFLALVPFVIYNYVGFELPSTATDEMTDPQRTVPFAILRSGIGAFLLYGGPILGILLVVPADRIKSLGGFIDACKSVLTVYGGSIAGDGTVTLTGAGHVFGMICAAGLIVGVLTSGVGWAIGAHRAQAVACADGAGPRYFGEISAKHGTPIRINVLSGVLATLVMVAALAITGGDAEKYFSAGLALTISTTFISYVVTFPSLLALRRKQPDVPRPFRVGGGTWGVAIVTLVPTAFVAFTVATLIWPGIGVGWFGTSGSPDDSLPSSFAGQRWPYFWSQLIPLALVIGIGVLFQLIGRRREVRDPLHEMV